MTATRPSYNNPAQSALVTFAGTLSTFSMWHQCPFSIRGMDFISVGQYLAWKRASINGAFDVAEAIYEAESVEEIRALARSIQQLEPDTWRSVAPSLALEAAFAKFSNNKELLVEMLNTGSAFLVEVNPFDTFWSSGLDAFDPQLEEKLPQEWPGQNTWGCVLMDVRATLWKSLKVAQSMSAGRPTVH